MAGTETPAQPAASEAATTPDSGTAPASPVAEVGPGRRMLQQIAENPLQSLFGAAIIALLTFTLTSTHARFGDVHQRIDDLNASVNARFDDVSARFDDVSARIDATNERITRLEERMEARFEALEASVAEINLKLTALIAALNMSAQVDAAQEGRLIDTEQAPDPE